MLLGDGLIDFSFFRFDERAELWHIGGILALFMLAGAEEINFVLRSPLLEEEAVLRQNQLAQRRGCLCISFAQTQRNDQGRSEFAVILMGVGDPVDGSQRNVASMGKKVRARYVFLLRELANGFGVESTIAVFVRQ